MPTFYDALRDLWPIFVTLIICVAALLRMRTRINEHHNVLYDDHGQLQVVTLPVCTGLRGACGDGVSCKVEEIKKAVDGLDEALEKRVRRLHEKREVQERAWGHDLQRINYFMGAVATKLNLPDPPEQKGSS